MGKSILSCDHCNSIKNNVSDRKDNTLDVLDCADFSTIVTVAIHFYCEGKPREKVIITPVLDEPGQNVLDTVLLLNNIFNYHSESLAFDAKVLTDEVIKEMKSLLDLLHKYEYDSHSKDKQNRVKNDIKDLLSIEASFTAFKIWYIKRNYKESDYINFCRSLLQLRHWKRHYPILAT
ncbi:MAG: hypothetical protein IPO92_03095 [Saprospiraceae bacterium]|nr:hypothetical protein [Saprospiraceae bacterium]